MLSWVKIQNLVLVERAEIELGPNLNILTGETGSGKSAILSAIRLIAGERADTQLIGNKGDLAIVEARLDAFLLPDEISPPPQGQPLSIRREIHRSGKSRCFIEDQQVSLALLRQVAGSSIEFVDAMSSSGLCSSEEQRKMLDAAAQVAEEVKAFSVSFSEEMAEQKRLDELLLSQETRSRDLKWTEEDLSIIESVNWRVGEEESLAQEHQVLSHSQELLEKVSSACEIVSHPGLKRSLPLLENALRFDARLTPLFESTKTALLEIDEVGQNLRTYLSKLDVDPKRLELLEKRIGAIESLKKRFGKTVQEVEEKRKELLGRVERLAHLDEELAALRTSLQQKREKNHSLAASISARRREAAPLFARQILAELKELNIPHAQLEISVAPKPLCCWGGDEIRFLFSANPGHAPIPLEDCASGGELARLLLAIKTVLAEKEKRACLVFDEIDSNVGGQTASVLGEKLKQISLCSQVICVTHFVQVARCASHHFAVSKNDRAVTTISSLKPAEREKEHLRMMGAGNCEKRIVEQ